MQGYNPFAPLSLLLPESVEEQVNRLVRQGVKDASPVDRPFARKVDVWSLSIAFAVANSLPPAEGIKLKRFADGSVLQRNSQVVTLIELLAIGKTGNPQVIAEPQEVIGFANAYAASGVEMVLEAADQPGLPVWKVGERAFDHAVERVGPPLSSSQLIDS